MNLNGPTLRMTLGLSLGMTLGLAFLACGGDAATTVGAPEPAAVKTPVEPYVVPPVSTAPLPGESLYHLPTTWTDQAEQTRSIAEFRGHVVVLAMMFTHCDYACPRIVADMKAIEAGVEADEALDVRFVLASYDTKRDTPETLRAFAKDKELNLARWTLLHGKPEGVRELSAAMGGTYAENDLGNFAHSNQVVVLDRDGRIVHVQDGLGIAPDKALAAIEKLRR
ncbi:MAG: SCO family protein [Myxococcota bacterium]